MIASYAGGPGIRQPVPKAGVVMSMNLDAFNELIDEIMSHGIDEKTASHYAALVGDTPIVDDQCNAVVMHPRFLLTDLGGMNFENGLDEGEPGTFTLVSPLEHTVWQKCVSDYCRGSATFTITPDGIITVPGRG